MHPMALRPRADNFTYDEPETPSSADYSDSSYRTESGEDSDSDDFDFDTDDCSVNKNEYNDEEKDQKVGIINTTTAAVTTNVEPITRQRVQAVVATEKAKKRTVVVTKIMQKQKSVDMRTTTNVNANPSSTAQQPCKKRKRESNNNNSKAVL